MYPKTNLIFHNGAFVQAQEANTSVYSQSLHYGVGVIDGLRAYQTPEGTQIFKAQAHYERFIDSAQRMDIKIPYSSEELVQLSYRLLEYNKLQCAYIRPLVYVGINMDMETSPETNIVLTSWNWENYQGGSPLDLMVSSYRRLHPSSSMVDAKITGNYINSVMAINEAKQNGYDAALLLDANGFVAEGAGSNFFYEKDQVLYTPPKGTILPGITRATVLDIARELQVPVVEKYFQVDDLKEADAAFFTGTASEISQIRSVNGHTFRLNWEETIAREIQLKYHQLVTLADFDRYAII